MEAALSLIMAMCLSGNNDYHACHQEIVECAKEISEHNNINLWQAVNWCDSYAKEIDNKLFEQKEIKVEL